MSTPTNASRLTNDSSQPAGKPKSDRSPLEGSTVEPSQQRTVPRNLANKDPDQVVDDYAKLQAAYGRQSNELGELRRQIQELQASKAEPEPEYWEDPDKAVAARIKPLEQKLSAMEQQRLQAELRASHPDYQDIVQGPEFGEWIREKRSRMLLAMSGDAGDVDAARELLDQYKEAIETDNATPQEAIRRDRLGRASATERGTGRRPSGQVWSRIELQNMRAFNPRRYQELLPEIKRAYAEGRVRDG